MNEDSFYGVLSHGCTINDVFQVPDNVTIIKNCKFEVCIRSGSTHLQSSMLLIEDYKNKLQFYDKVKTTYGYGWDNFCVFQPGTIIHDVILTPDDKNRTALIKAPFSNKPIKSQFKRISKFNSTVQNYEITPYELIQNFISRNPATEGEYDSRKYRDIDKMVSFMNYFVLPLSKRNKNKHLTFIVFACLEPCEKLTDIDYGVSMKEYRDRLYYETYGMSPEWVLLENIYEPHEFKLINLSVEKFKHFDKYQDSYRFYDESQMLKYDSFNQKLNKTVIVDSIYQIGIINQNGGFEINNLSRIYIIFYDPTFEKIYIVYKDGEFWKIDSISDVIEYEKLSQIALTRGIIDYVDIVFSNVEFDWIPIGLKDYDKPPIDSNIIYMKYTNEWIFSLDRQTLNFNDLIRLNEMNIEYIIDEIRYDLN